MSHVLAPRLPIYYGWVIAAVMGVVSFSSVAFTPAMIGSFFTPMALEFEWSRSLLSGALMAGSIVALGMAPIAGWLTDRYGGRFVLTGAVLTIVLALVGMGMVRNPLMYYVFLGLGVGTVVGPIRIAPAAAISQWFVQRRGAAISVLGVGIAMGFAVLPMLGEVVTSVGGWRMGWWAVGATVLALALLPCILLLTRHPSEVGQSIDGGLSPRAMAGMVSADSEAQWSAGEALRTPALWMLTLSTSLIVMAFMALSTHLVPYLIDRGVNSGLATLTINVGGLVMIPASLAWGWLLDHVAPRNLVAATAAFTIVLIRILAAVNGAWVVAPVGLVWGIGSASTGTVLRVVFPYYFGRESAGTVLGIVTPFRVVSQGAGILLAGVFYDATGSYVSIFWWFTAFMVVAALVALLTPTPHKTGLSLAAYR